MAKENIITAMENLRRKKDETHIFMGTMVFYFFRIVPYAQDMGNY